MSNDNIPEERFQGREFVEKEEDFNEALHEIELANLEFFQSQEPHDENEKGTDTTRKATAETTYSYDLAKPAKKWTLPNVLLEISGITWIDNNHLLVIEDLRPNLYLLRLDNDAQIEKTIPFHETSKEKFDIEDVTVA